jgi:serine/threonine protein kinase
MDSARVAPPLASVRLLSFEQAHIWLSDMLRAALFLWQHRVVHLDVKLDNMLMDDMGRLLFCDLGYAVYLVRLSAFFLVSGPFAPRPSPRFAPSLFIVLSWGFPPPPSVLSHMSSLSPFFGQLVLIWPSGFSDSPKLVLRHGWFACLQTDGRTFTMREGYRFGGNEAHLAPELLDANWQLAHGASEVSPDLTKHMVFACAVAMVELIRLPSQHPLPCYYRQYVNRSTGLISYTEESMTGLPAQEDLVAAGCVT